MRILCHSTSLDRFSKHNATSKENATARRIVWTRFPVHMLTSSGQGRVTFTTAFPVCSRRQHNASDRTAFISVLRKQGKKITLYTENYLFKHMFSVSSKCKTFFLHLKTDKKLPLRELEKKLSAKKLIKNKLPNRSAGFLPQKSVLL